MVDEYGDLPVHPYTGLVAIGVLPSGRPVWPVAGGAPDDDDGDGGGDDSSDDDTDDGDEGANDSGGGDDWTPPTKEQWEEALRKQAKVNKEAARRREQTKALQAQIDDLKDAQKQAKASGDDKDAKKIAAELADAQAKVNTATARGTAALKAAVRQAILNAGYTGKRDGQLLPSLVGMVKVADLEIDEDGEITGLDEEIEKVTSELPDLFRKPEDKPKPKAPKADAGGKKPPPPPEPTYIDRLAAQMGRR